VYPGTSLVLAFPEGWKTEEADPSFALELEAIALAAPESAGRPTMRVDGAGDAPMTGEGLHRSAKLALTPPTGAWTLRVEAPADGGWLLLRRLRIGNAADARVIFGEDGASSVPALAAGTTYAAPPPELPALPPFEAHEGSVARADLSGLGVPDTDALWKVGSVAGCSPLRVSEDGTLLPSPVVRLQDVIAKAKGAYAQVGSALYALGADGSSPAMNGRRYAAALEPTRACRGLRWVYPGDVATIQLPALALARLHAPATSLELGGAAVVPEGQSPEARLVVRIGDEVRLDTTFPLDTLAAKPPSWAFDPPLPRGPAPLRVEISTAADAPYLLLSSVALTAPASALPSAPAATKSAGGAP
jgi:hypothetical protein